MTQSPFDQLAKQYLEEFLSPIGRVDREYEIPGEAKYVDVWFTPNKPITEPIDDLGLLSEIVKTPALLEPYRNPPSREEIRSCLSKLLWLQEETRRKNPNAPETELPTLWILASHISKPVLKDFHAHKTRIRGVYTLGPGLRTKLVSIDELPQTQATLWIRILGRDETQTLAIQEVVNLPSDHPRRERILRLLAAWKVRIDIGEVQDFLQQETVMAYPQAFLDWEEATEKRGQDKGISIGEERGQRSHALSLVRRLLRRRFGELPSTIETEIEKLSLDQLDQLGEDLLEFIGIENLQQWINDQRQRVN